MLNVELSMQHHHDVYGYWSDAVGDYTDLKVMDRIHTPEFRKLMRVVDPFVYVNRYTMPKYIICSTGTSSFSRIRRSSTLTPCRGRSICAMCPIPTTG